MSTARTRQSKAEIVPFPIEPTLPHDIALEQSVIAAVLMHNEDNAALRVVKAILKPTHFFRPDHREVFEEILKLERAGKVVDGLILSEALESRNAHGVKGVRDTLSEILAQWSNSANAQAHAQKVRELADSRAVIEHAERLAREGYSRTRTIDELLESARAGLEAISAEAGRAGSPTVCLLGVEPLEVDWFWEGRIPSGMLTTFASPGGLGKTMISLDIVSRNSTGEPWPDSPGVRRDPMSSLFISGEDTTQHVLVPRLRACGADMARVHTLSDDELSGFTLADLSTLERALAGNPDINLVIIDPATSFLGGIDGDKNSELRSILTPLKHLAEKYGVAIVLITHVNKSSGGSAANKVIGSVAWTNACRANHMFFKDPSDKDRRLFVPGKINVAREPTGLAYRIDPDKPRVIWEGEVAINADEAHENEARSDKGKRGPAPEKSMANAKWLWETLRSAGSPVRLKDLIEMAESAEILKTPKPGGKLSTTPLYNAREKIPDCYAGYHVDEFLIDSRKHWRLTPDIESGVNGQNPIF